MGARLVIVLLAAAVACGAAEPAASASGIRGSASVGPQCPVVQAGSPCPDAPFDGEIRVSTPAGEPVTTAPTDPAGAFEIRLEPGTYVVDVVPTRPGAPPFAEPVTVVVRAGSFTDVELSLDSGIR